MTQSLNLSFSESDKDMILEVDLSPDAEAMVVSNNFLNISEEKTIAKINNNIATLNEYYVEREEVIKGLFCGLLAEKNVLFIGEPGTGKSHLIKSFSQVFKAFKYFYLQLRHDTNTDEFLGVLDINALKDGKRKRIHKGFAPDAEIVDLDEVFRAPSGVLTAMNEIMNERTVNHKQTKIRMVTGSTNFTSDADEAKAFVDRWILKYNVLEIEDDLNFLKVMLSSKKFTPDIHNIITKTELNAIIKKTQEVDIEGIIDSLLEIRAELKVEFDIDVSTRKWKQSMDILRAHAIINGRGAVNHSDLIMLLPVVWSDGRNFPSLKKFFMERTNPNKAKIEKIYNECIKLLKDLEGFNLYDSQQAQKILQTMQNATELVKDLYNFKSKLVNDPDNVKYVEELTKDVNNKIKDYQARVLRNK